jgi:hypothetical protein
MQRVHNVGSNECIAGYSPALIVHFLTGNVLRWCAALADVSSVFASCR